MIEGGDHTSGSNEMPSSGWMCSWIPQMVVRASVIFVLGCGGSLPSTADGNAGLTDSAGPVTRTGFMNLASFNGLDSSGAPQGRGLAAAAFFATGSTCIVGGTIGACAIENCTTTAPPTTYAGTITITGAAMPISLDKDPMYPNQYTELDVFQALFLGGENITFSATGADVPAFNTQLVAPPKVTLTTPAEPAAGGSILMSQSQDFTIRWSGDNASSDVLEVQVLDASSVERILCKFPAPAGSAVIPAQALATIPGPTGALQVASFVETTVTASDWHVDVDVNQGTVWPDDHSTAGEVQFQ